MTEREAILRKILENPDDDNARLVYSDWLRDHDEPAGEDRGRYIAYYLSSEGRDYELHKDTDLERTRFPSDCEYPIRSGAWPHEEWPDSFSTLMGMTGGSYPHHGMRWRRGFIASVEMPMADFLKRAKSLFSTHPITQVTLSDRNPRHPGPRTWFWWTTTADVRPHFHAAFADSPDRVSSSLRHFLTNRRKTMRSGRKLNRNLSRHTFAKESQAREALSHACVDYGRYLAGLPRWWTQKSGYGDAIPADRLFEMATHELEERDDSRTD